MRGGYRRVEGMRRARDFLILEFQIRAEDFLKGGFFGGERGGILDFLQHFCLFYPCLHGFEPRGAVSLQTLDLLLYCPLVGHKCASPRKIGVALDILRDIEVGEAIELPIRLAQFFAKRPHGVNGRALRVVLVLLHPALEVSRPLAREHEHGEELGKIGGERFFADVGLRTASRRFLGTAIVHIAVDVAVLLALHAHLGRYRHAALATFHQAAEHLRLGRGDLRMPALFHHLLHLIEKPLVHDGRMPPFVKLARIEKVAVIERVGEDEFDAVVVNAVAVETADAIVVQKLPDVLEPLGASSVSLEGGADHFRLLAVERDGLGARVVPVPCRSRARKVPLPRLGAEPACSVHGKLADKLIRHSELHRHHEHVVGRIVRAVVRLDMRDNAALEEPLYLPAVHRITRKAVDFPANDALRLTPLYPRHHLAKHGAAGHLRTFLLDELLRDF